MGQLEGQMSSGVIVRVTRIQLSILRRSQKQVRVERSMQSNEEPKQQIEKHMTFHCQRVRMGILRKAVCKHIQFEMNVKISLNFNRSNCCLTEEDYHEKCRRHAGIWAGCHIFVEIYGSYWTNCTHTWIVYGKQNDFFKIDR